MKYLLLILLSACGVLNPKKETKDPTKLEQLTQKYEVYRNLSATQQDGDGFILTYECDSLLFSGLYGTTVSVNLIAAKDASGKWHRRPLSYQECYPNGSPSSISRDMLIGLLWWTWRNQRLDIAQDLFNYGSKRDWIMGDGDIARTYFAPGLQATLAEIIYKLGGKDMPVYRGIPQIYSIGNTGYMAHLDILHILLRAELVGNIGSQESDVIKAQHSRVPQNPLFTYAYSKFFSGNQDGTIDQLLNEKYWPKDRLPNASDRCEPWLVQRDPGKDWESCDSGHIHPGADFMFIANLILGGH